MLNLGKGRYLESYKRKSFQGETVYEHRIKPDPVLAHHYKSCSISEDFRGCKGTKEFPCIYGRVRISHSLHRKKVWWQHNELSDV